MRLRIQGNLLAFVGVVLAVTAGCETTEYTAEMGQAADEVAERTGWRPDWTVPWADYVPPWDGIAPLSVQQAVTIALQNNRTLRVEIEEIGVARADLVQAGLLPNPVLSLIFGFPEGGMGSPRIVTDFAQPLRDLWLMPSRKEAAEAQLQRQVLDVSTRALQLVADIQASHARIDYAERALDLLEENDDLARQSQMIVERQRAAGTAASLDVNRARVESLLLSAERISLRNELETEKRRLLELMGLAGGPTDWTIRVAPDPDPGPIDEERVITVARGQRLDVLAARWSIHAGAQRIIQRKLEILPDLSIGFELERFARPKSTNPTAGEFLGNEAAQAAVNRAFGLSGPFPPVVAPFGSDPFIPDYTIGPSLSFDIPIFDQQQARIAAARAELAGLLARAAAVEQQAIRQVRQAVVQYEQGLRLVRFYRRELMPVHEENLDLARRGFEAGQQDLTVLLVVQRELVSAKLNQARAIRDAQLARVELDRAVGGSLLLPITLAPLPDTPDETPADHQTTMKPQSEEPDHVPQATVSHRDSDCGSQCRCPECRTAAATTRAADDTTGG